MTDKKITEKEEKVMFHTLGYDYQPRWNDTKGGYRNWFGIYPSEDNGDYIAIKSLVEKGFMQKYGYYSEESFNHYLNRQQKVFLGHLKALKTWRDFYGLKQRLYERDTQKHNSLFHPWRKQTLIELKPHR